MYVCIYIYIYICIYTTWLRTNWVNTNGAAAKVLNFSRFEKRVHPGTFGKIKLG